ncbi:hypothetical protein SPFL3102_03511 [Sporomusaceae bacterium FL31]|nr:hypothetical protein SPFL3101_02384 [Sporomusaceae bacterium FL31]GCE35660.1 hypothetical protein SPFL3102_03511 [Sporomusaceae bacterium]
MNKVTKKIITYSMLGLMQVGIFATAVEASPRYNNNPPNTIQFDDRRDNHRDDNDRRREHDDRRREENERHEREMKRRPHESDREWHARQERERERHEQALREIAALLIGIAIGSNN